MSKNFKSVALLVLNYNAKPFLKGCLDSMLNQTYRKSRVFLIDNHSTDGSTDFVKKNYPQVNLIENPENFGVGKGFNIAIKKAMRKFDYIGLFSTDIRLAKNWLQETVGTLDDYPKVQICNSLTLNWDGTKVDNLGGAITNIFAGILTGFLGDLPVEKIPLKYQKKEFPVMFVVATGMLVRASAFEKFGLYDEDYFVYFEDIDFGWRVSLGGGKILCNPQALVYHYGHGSKMTKKISLKLLKLTEINLLATYVKNLSLSSLILLLPSVLFFRLIASLFYLMISPKITWAKIKGIGLFLKKLLFGQYRQSRQFVAKIRKLSDLEVLALNPTPLVSFKPVISVMSDWLTTIKKIYERS